MAGSVADKNKKRCGHHPNSLTTVPCGSACCFLFLTPVSVQRSAGVCPVMTTAVVKMANTTIIIIITTFLSLMSLLTNDDLELLHSSRVLNLKFININSKLVHLSTHPKITSSSTYHSIRHHRYFADPPLSSTTLPCRCRLQRRPKTIIEPLCTNSSSN